MYRIIRPGCVLACGLLAGTSALAAEPDYVLEKEQAVFAVASASSSTNIDKHDAVEAAIAAAPERRVVLLAWAADDQLQVTGDDDKTVVHNVDNEFEIFAQLIDATTLDNAPKTRISVMGDDTASEASERQRYSARNPAVAWNPVAEEFLIAWEGDDDSAPLVDDEFEIFAQRVHTNGTRSGSRIRVSAMGNDSATSGRDAYGAAHPAIAVDPVTGNYLVVWQGDDDTAPLVDGETEIFGRVFDVDGKPLTEQFRISVTGDDAATGNDRTRYDAVMPAVVFNPVAGTFFVAWQADDSEAGLIDGENEIFLQQVKTDGTLTGTPVRVSAMGADGDASRDALAPTLAVDPESGTMLVAWHGDTDVAPLVDDEFEIHARLFDMAGVALSGQFRVSTMGTSAFTGAARAAFDATSAAAAWGENDQRFFIAWKGDTTAGDLVDDEFEIFGAFVALDGTIDADEIRLSVQGDDEETDAAKRVLYGADRPAVAYAANNWVAAWEGDSNPTDGRMAIFGQRVAVTSTNLDLDVTSLTPDRRVPNPVEIGISLTNTGSATARNSSLRADLSDFPFSWSGCESVSENLCEIGDIEPGEVVELVLVLTTDHIELGDKQSTNVSLIARTDTALVDPAISRAGVFVGVALEIEGGSGALNSAWLLLLAVCALLVSQRRRQR